MDSNDIKVSVEKYVRLIREGSFNSEENENVLIKILDELAFVVYQVSYEFDETDYSESKEKAYEENRVLVEKRFPNYGRYNHAEDVTISIGESKILVGDAIDDVTDIYGEMVETLWRWENNSEADALWYFQDSFNHHWEHHLRGLQGYLYELENGS